MTVNNVSLSEDNNEEKIYDLEKSKPKMSSSLLSGIQMISKSPASPAKNVDRPKDEKPGEGNQMSSSLFEGIHAIAKTPLNPH